MKKEDRCKVDEVYVCGFVPNHMLPNKCAISLDPFLQILVEEIEDLFVNGIEVEYAGQLDGFPPGKMVIRCLLLLWTGDYPAQSQVGKFIQGGMRPCRRCNLVAYGFNVLKDLVFDGMHDVPLNVIKHHLEVQLELGLLNKATIEERLEAMPWTSEKFPPAILPADQQCGAHSSQGEAIPTKEGAEPPQGNAFPPQDGIYIYPPQSGAYPLQGGAYPLQGGVCPPQGGAYPPQGGVYPQQGDSYPRQGDANPQQGGAYPPQGGAYAPQGGAYPSQGDSYMPQGNSYPPQGDANPQQGGAYAPQGGAYPPQGGAYPSQGGAYPPQGGAYPEYPPQLGGVRPGFNGSPPPYYPQATPQQQTNVVIVQPKSTAPVRTKVGDYGYILSIVFTIICLFGGSWLSLCCTIPAIFVASSARDAASRGDLEDAKRSGRTAYGLNGAAVVAFVITWVAVAIRAVL
ncbi:hypothetical protein EMCRGX_G010352 [Ephydatia muelleri]